MPAFVLASGSPRRRAFLEELGYRPEVLTSDIPEVPAAHESAEACARRLSGEKASAVYARRPDAVVLAADTVVTIGGRILGKPMNESDFSRMMALLSGATHEVITAVAISSAAGLDLLSVRTAVTFRPISVAEIDWYWGTGEPRDKAGGYALQGAGGAFITGISGSHSNVIGLPLVETVEMLDRAGIAPPWRRT